jgi:hypothetical protein
MYTLHFCFFLFFLPLLVLATQAEIGVQQLATFPYMAENIAARWNRDLLVTSIMSPSITYLNLRQANPTTVLSPILGKSGVNDIAKISSDVFVVAAAIWNVTVRRSEQTTIWTDDFRHVPPERPDMKRLVDVKEKIAMNALTHIPGSSIVLAAHSDIGAVYRETLDDRLLCRHPRQGIHADGSGACSGHQRDSRPRFGVVLYQ